MKKYGEIIGTENRKHLIRIYKEKDGELSPTALTVTASGKISCNAGDMVEVSVNTPLFIASTLSGYLLPFLVAWLVVSLIASRTDNILIAEALLLFALLATYVLTLYISSLPFFRRISACTITEKVEIE